MVTKGKKKGEYRFVYKPSGEVKKVSVAGNFNQWAFNSKSKHNNSTYEWKCH